MVVKIRLARFGKRHQPLYNIVVAQARSARNSKPMEVLGTYDPTPRVPLASNTPPSSQPTQQSTSQLETAPPAAQPSSVSQPTPSQPPRIKRYKSITLDTPRTKYWLGVGAQPSEPVARLLSLLGLVELKPGRSRERREA